MGKAEGRGKETAREFYPSSSAMRWRGVAGAPISLQLDPIQAHLARKSSCSTPLRLACRLVNPGR